MKKLIVTEQEKKEIIEKYYSSSKLNEGIKPQTLGKLFSNLYDDIFRNFTDDAIIGFDKLFAGVINRTNAVEQGGKLFLISAREGSSAIPMSTIEELLLNVSKGKLQPEEVAKYLPEKLKDGTEFRKKMFELMKSKVSKELGQEASRITHPIIKKYVVKGCFSRFFCPRSNELKNLLKSRLPSSSLEFDPQKIRIIEGPINDEIGREIMTVEMPNGEKLIWNSSSGSNIKTTGKEKGTWSVIPGFAEDGWFIKDDELIALTRGGNKYLTDMANYLEKNGSHSISGHIDHVKRFE